MAKVNFNRLDTADKLQAARDNLVGRADTLKLDIHKWLIAVAAHWASTGDNRHVAGLINGLLDGDNLQGLRKNSIRDWAVAFLGMVYNEETKSLVMNAKFKHTDLKIADMANKAWWNFSPEQPYKPMDSLKGEIDRILKRARTDRERLGDESKVEPELLAALAMLATTPVEKLAKA